MSDKNPPQRKPATPVSLLDLEKDSILVSELAKGLREARAGRVDSQTRSTHFAAMGDKGKIAPPRGR